MQPAQRLLSCLFCLLSQGRESHRERERERGGERGDCCKPHVWKTIFYSSISKRQTRTHFVALKPETGLLTVKKGGMLVLQISDPCLAAKPKQIPFQAAHLRGSSLSPLLSRLKARDIWRRLLECKIQAFSVIGIRSASLFFFLFFLREWKHVSCSIKTLLPGKLLGSVFPYLPSRSQPPIHVIYYKGVISDKPIERIHAVRKQTNNLKSQLNPPGAHTVYTFVILFITFSVITFPQTSSVNKKKKTTPYAFWVWGGRKCRPFWHVVMNGSNWGLQSTESTSHIHRQTHFSPDGSWKFFMCKKKKKITRREFVYIHLSLLGK